MTDMAVPSGGFPWITLVVFLPLVGVIAIVLAKEELAKWIGFAASSVVLLMSLPLWGMFNEATSAMQFVEKHPWIASPSINYAVGVDGISLPLVLLTTFLTPLCVLVSWTSINTRVREFMISLLVMETATLGVFVSLDFVLFYIFWETMLIPMYLLIGVWGGANRVYAAIKFFLYTLAGSVLLLVAIIVIFFNSGENTFNPLRIQRKNPERHKPHMTDTGIRNKLLEVRLRKSHVRAIDDGDNRQRHNDRSEGERGIR